MTVRYDLPSPTELETLVRQQDLAVTIYAATSPVVHERERAQVAVKSFFDEAIERAKALGASSESIETVRKRQAQHAGSAELWTDVSRSLAIFVSPDVDEAFVLPNHLEDGVHVGRHFELGQLLRARGRAQEAYALTLSANSWQLWHATPTARAEVLDLKGEWAHDAESVVPRTGPRDSLKRSAHEYQKMLIEGYAAHVADAVKQELGAVDGQGTVPLVVFANDPLASLFLPRVNGRRALLVKGAPDHLDAASIDEAIRDRLAAIAIDDTNAALAALAEGDQSRVERDIAAIGRAAVIGAVDTFYFDFTSREQGVLDEETGAVQFAGAGHDEEHLADGSPAEDVLARIASVVLSRGGEVVAVRGADLDPSIWRSPAVARLRFPVTR
ncbi:MAG: hypothetical protein L0H25_09240 [Micrococcales bacterium]|nr:hypothetical protein [Micrococcales bacterium]